AEAAARQTARPRIAYPLDPSVRLDEWRLDEELGEHFFRPFRVARHALPLREDLTVLRLEIQEKVTHLPSELVRLFAFEKDGQVRGTSPLHDERVAPVGDGAQALAAQDRGGCARVVLDDIECRTEQVLVDDRLTGSNLRADQGPVLEREEDRLDGIAAGLEQMDRFRDPLPARWVERV